MAICTALPVPAEISTTVTRAVAPCGRSRHRGVADNYCKQAISQVILISPRVETMYFQHNPISRDLALNTSDLDPPLRRDFRHTRKASGRAHASSKNVLRAY